MVLLVLLFACAPLDEKVCLPVEPDDECPSEDDASDELVGGETCEDPVRVVTRTGALIERVDDCIDNDPDHNTCCCYEAHLRDRHGETCVPGETE
jgi:hypothetical protein